MSDALLRVPVVAAGVVAGFASMKARKLVTLSEEQKKALRESPEVVYTAYMLAPPLLVTGTALALGGYRSPGVARDIAYGAAGVAALYGFMYLFANR